MATKERAFTSKQLLFKELFVGTLIYAVVLGFFNDYTSVVYAKSFSTIFLAAIVLEILTYLTLLLKGWVMSQLKGKQGAGYRTLMFFSVWLVLFLSKFVFIWAIDITFGDTMNINGFFGVLWIALSVTVAHKLADKTFKSLGGSENNSTS